MNRIADDEKNLVASLAVCAASFLLSRTVIFGEFAPFSISITSAFSGRRKMLPAFIGAMLGYLVFTQKIDSVKYIAAATMLFIVSELVKRYVYIDKLPYAVTSYIFSLGISGLIFLISDASGALKAISFIAELTLGAFACAMFRAIIVDRKINNLAEYGEKRMVCIFTLLSIIFASLPEITPGNMAISIGRAAGMLLIMIASNHSGVYGGVLTGIIIGLTMDISGVEAPVYTAAYASAGLICGFFKNKNKAVGAVVFTAAVLVVILFISGGELPVGNILEAAAAGAVFVAAPKKFGVKFCEIDEAAGDRYGDRIKKQLSAKLTGMATAYSELARNVSETVVQKKEDKFNPYYDVCRYLCSDCDCRLKCWKDNLDLTEAALSRAQLPALARGRADPGDFGTEFVIKCKNIQLFCAYVTNSIRKYRDAKRRIAEENENKKLLSKQYEQLSEILDISAEELNENMLFEKETEVKVKRALAEKNIFCEAIVYRDKNDMLHLEVCGEDLSEFGCNIEGMTDELSELVGCRLSKPEQISGNGISCFSFTQDPKYTCAIGACAEKKKNENISGDCGTYFIGKDGCTYVILCDGMGSGKQAHKDAKNALQLLESFLKAGIDPRYAANIVKSALEIKSDGSKFATIDITVINPMKSEALLIKCGAAPTYIRRKCAAGDFSVLPIEANNGAGYAGQGEAFVKTVRLYEGDMVVMVSDGIDMGGDDRVKNMLAKVNSDDPRELCDILLKTVKNASVSDDRTAIAILYEKVLEEV